MNKEIKNTSDQKNTDNETPKHQWSVAYLCDEFEKESDRAAVILVASLIDESLTCLLKSYLVPIAQAQDASFDSATAPLSTFSAKIDIAHRIGLLSAKLCRDLHLIRKIRNSFAHDIYNCSFNNGSVHSRVDEIYKSMNELKQEKDADTRSRFLYISSGILWHLNDLNQKTESIHNPKEEWLYVKQKKHDN